MIADMGFEARVRAILESLAPQLGALEMDAAVTALDAARAETQHSRLQAIADMIADCMAAEGEDADVVARTRRLLQTRLAEILDGADDALDWLARLNQVLGGGVGVNTTLGEVLCG